MNVRNEIKHILSPPEPRDARLHGGVIDFEAKWTKRGLDFLIERIMETIKKAQSESESRIRREIGEIITTLKNESNERMKDFGLTKVNRGKWEEWGAVCAYNKVIRLLTDAQKVVEKRPLSRDVTPLIGCPPTPLTKCSG